MHKTVADQLNDIGSLPEDLENEKYRELENLRTTFENACYEIKKKSCTLKGSDEGRTHAFQGFIDATYELTKELGFKAFIQALTTFKEKFIEKPQTQETADVKDFRNSLNGKMKAAIQSKFKDYICSIESQSKKEAQKEAISKALVNSSLNTNPVWTEACLRGIFNHP
jgi:hypothetical protein